MLAFKPSMSSEVGGQIRLGHGEVSGQVGRGCGLTVKEKEQE